ncbi:hypothetical protein ACQ4M4_17350 [Leptolyngbya sp. AN02str]|uniref:hypothetical protein n=1 Tax=Leptolyngbya sp. AN02str TaxID=3423363 RepID=UPI003D321377
MKQPDPTEQRVVLSDVSWQQFEALLHELGPNRTTRLTYSGRKLEMMSPLPEQTRCRKLIDSLIQLVAEAQAQPITAIAPVQLLHSDWRIAIAPSAIYYMGHNPTLDGITQVQDEDGEAVVTLDVNQAAPPQLAIDIAINKRQLKPLPIYASLGVSEVWCYQTFLGDDALKGELKIFNCQNDTYTEHRVSQLLPSLTVQRIQDFLQHSEAMGLVKAIALVREWASHPR